MSEHTTPSGTTYTLRTPQEVPEGLRRPYVAKVYENLRETDDEVLAAAEDGDNEAAKKAAKKAAVRNMGAIMQANDETDDLLAVAMVAKWSLDLPIVAESFALHVTKGDYEHIRAAIAPFALALLPDFGPTPEDGTPFTPSEPSSPTFEGSTSAGSPTSTGTTSS